MRREPMRLSSAANQRVKAVAKLWQHRQRRADGRFVAEGWRQVLRAADAGLQLRELYATEELLGDAAVAALGSAAADGCYEVTDAVMAKMAYREHAEGVLGVFDEPRWTWEDAVGAGKQWPGGRLVLVASGIEKPGNLGAMARTAAGAGATSLIVADGVADAFNPNAIHASTGAVFGLPIVSGSGAEVRRRLSAAGLRVVATTPAAPRRWCDADLRGDLAIVVGAEDRGLDEGWLGAEIEQVSITMADALVDSLNASVAAAVLLFEAVRQRRA